MQHIYAVGETILDIIFRDNQPRTARPGGSSFNASITLGRLGSPITFISEMGNDRVGDMIHDFLVENGVNTNHISRFEHGKSAIALAFLNQRSDAEYEFYKDYPHQRLNVEFPEFNENDLLLFGSFYALNPGIRPRVKELLDQARSAGTINLYDPNFRESHAHERDELLDVIRENMEYATIVRASDEDLLNIFGVDNPDDAWEQVRQHSPVMIYTANAHGVYLRTGKLKLHLDVEMIEPVSTIGAGDTFNAGLIYGLHRRRYNLAQINALNENEWKELLDAAIAFSRQVCMSLENYLPIHAAEKVKLSIPLWKKED